MYFLLHKTFAKPSYHILNRTLLKSKSARYITAFVCSLHVEQQLINNNSRIALLIIKNSPGSLSLFLYLQDMIRAPFRDNQTVTSE